VEDPRARGDLGRGVGLHARHVSPRDLFRELRASGRVDPFPDDHEWVLGADRHFEAASPNRRRDRAHCAIPTSFLAISTASGALFAYPSAPIFSAHSGVTGAP